MITKNHAIESNIFQIRNEAQRKMGTKSAPPKITYRDEEGAYPPNLNFRLDNTDAAYETGNKKLKR
jgi:hypothetical protein